MPEHEKQLVTYSQTEYFASSAVVVRGETSGHDIYNLIIGIYRDLESE